MNTIALILYYGDVSGKACQQQNSDYPLGYHLFSSVLLPLTRWRLGKLPHRGRLIPDRWRRLDRGSRGKWLTSRVRCRGASAVGECLISSRCSMIRVAQLRKGSWRPSPEWAIPRRDGQVERQVRACGSELVQLAGLGLGPGVEVAVAGFRQEVGHARRIRTRRRVGNGRVRRGSRRARCAAASPARQRRQVACRPRNLPYTQALAGIPGTPSGAGGPR
jgi:hypothetical protein